MAAAVISITESQKAPTNDD